MCKTPPLLILLLVSSVCLQTACGAKTDAHATVVDTNEPEADAAEFVSAFERDESEATRSYLGKRIRIAGYVSNVEWRPDGDLTMTLKTSRSTFRPVRCVVKAGNDADSAAQFEPGSPVNISGRVSGFNESTYYVLLEDCQTL